MNRWDQIWYRDVPACRSYLLSKVLLLLFGFDAWGRVIERGVSHGAAGFNVAHFSWLDALQPLPTPALHLGALFVAGFVAFAMAFGGASRAGYAVVFAGYTYSWSMSRLDGYQHHYFLSMVLLCATFLPHHTQSHTADGSPDADVRPIGPSWAVLLISATNAIMYFYAVVTKLESKWLSGATVQYIIEHSARLGTVTDARWPHVGLAVGAIAIELVIAAGYAAVVLRPASRRWIRAAWIASVLLHISIEVVGMHIGIFSYYMLAISTVLFAPQHWLDRAAATLRGIGRRLAAKLPGDGKAVMLAVVVGACALIITGKLVEIEVPGAVSTAALVGCGAAVVALAAALSPDNLSARRVFAGFGGALALWWAAIATTEIEVNIFNLGGWL